MYSSLGQATAKMEFKIVLCLLICFATTTQSRSLVADSTTTDPRDSARFKAFEAKFLQMLGMKEKPRVDKNVVVPQYMLDLYHSSVKDPEYLSTNLVFKDFATTANTVRSFFHKGRIVSSFLSNFSNNINSNVLYSRFHNSRYINDIVILLSTISCKA